MNWANGATDHVVVRAAPALVLVVALGLAAACSRSSPPPAAPSDADAGDWSGTLSDVALGSGAVQMRLGGTPTLAGTWSVTVGGDTVGGTMSELPQPPGGSGRYWTLSCGAVAPQGVLILQSPLAGDVSGSYQSIGCGRLTSGAVRVAKR